MNLNEPTRLGWLAMMLAAIPTVGAAAPPKPGDKAPPFTVYLADKSQVTLDQLRGKVVLINYWATWCAPCKAEIPLLNSYNLTFKDRGFVLFGVLTRDSVPPKKLTAFAAKISYPLARGISNPYTTIGEAVPTNYVIDRKGVVRYAKAGAFSVTELRRLVDPLLDEKP